MTCIRIGRFFFSKRKDAEAEVRRILHSATFDVPLAGAERDMIAGLFDLHPHVAEVKQRQGILGFTVKQNDYHGALTRGFHALHARGTTPFSYMTCFDPRRATPNALSAMRAAIMLGQRTIMVRAFGGRETVECTLCHAPTGRPRAHVHHMPPWKFAAIAAAFLAEGTPQFVGSIYIGDSFADLADHHRWLAFHDARAVRVVVCAGCNAAAERA
jgi:hypothetical protein